MSQLLQSLDIREFATRHLVDVFDTMLSMKVVLSQDQTPPVFTSRVSGSVGFAGEDVNGAVYLHFSGVFAGRVASAMLGMGPQEVPADADVNDVIGEVTNMLAGGLKSALCDAGVTCAVSTPAVIRGTSFMIEAVPGVERIWLIFDCCGERLAVEIHIKGN